MSVEGAAKHGCELRNSNISRSVTFAELKLDVVRKLHCRERFWYKFDCATISNIHINFVKVFEYLVHEDVHCVLIYCAPALFITESRINYKNRTLRFICKMNE